MTNKRMKIPFGKYRGRAFPNIPSDYLEWLLTVEGISRDIKDEAMTVLMDRRIFADSVKKKNKNKKYKMKHIIVNTNKGRRYFPDTDDDQFNKWNSAGYISYTKMLGGHKAYLKYIKNLDKATLTQMENDNNI